MTLSVRDPAHQEHYAGKSEDWEKAEAVLVQALESKGWPYKRCEGEAVFYGPKIDVEVLDVLGRPWQLSTFPVRFQFARAFQGDLCGS